MPSVFEFCLCHAFIDNLVRRSAEEAGVHDSCEAETCRWLGLSKAEGEVGERPVGDAVEQARTVAAKSRLWIEQDRLKEVSGVQWFIPVPVLSHRQHKPIVDVGESARKRGRTA